MSKDIVKITGTLNPTVQEHRRYKENTNLPPETKTTDVEAHNMQVAKPLPGLHFIGKGSDRINKAVNSLTKTYREIENTQERRLKK
jgi:hypothetical protein